MQKSYTQLLRETRFYACKSSHARNLPELWQSKKGTEITQMNVAAQNQNIQCKKTAVVNKICINVLRVK